ncbi:MAG: glycosyl transferase family 2 [Bacteroidetes bacterium CG_4_8_14_3_um_filter_31_14]|nr:MAG: glycosyl transferase family 2 [Bacteroidetes bacterium CG_4_8_14_3_um_filter_31_14]
MKLKIVSEYFNSFVGVIIFVVAVLFAISFIVQLFYYLFFYLQLAFVKEQNNIENIPISVIICAHDEAENLEIFLPLVLKQNYPTFEVIVVNDCSEDNTEDVLKIFQKQYFNLNVTTIKKDEKFTHGKKLAQTIGIKAAKYETLLFTDADCYPENENWIKSVCSNYRTSTEIVLGYGAYEKTKGFLNKVIRFDTFFIALQYLSFALAGVPYMGVGRNLSYKKNLFFKNKGFANHARLLSGDDDLFVNETADSKNTKVAINAHSFTLSVPKKKFNFWLSQKKRHRTTFTRYKLKHKVLLALEPISRMLFYVCLITLLAFNFYPIIVISFFALRLIVQMLVIYFATRKLHEKDLLLYSPIFDFIFIFIGFIIFFSRKHKNPYAWR